MGDLGLIPGLGRSSGEGKGYPLQYSGLKNSTDCSPWGHKESDKAEQLSLSLGLGWRCALKPAPSKHGVMNKYLILTQNCDAGGSDAIVQIRLAPLLGSSPKFNDFDQNN